MRKKTPAGSNCNICFTAGLLIQCRNPLAVIGPLWLAKLVVKTKGGGVETLALDAAEELLLHTTDLLLQLGGWVRN